MNYRGAKTWQHFSPDIIAADGTEARRLKGFLKWAYLSRNYLNCLEVVDLQNYKLIRRKNKVYEILKLSPRDQVFLFVVNKN